MSRELTPRNDAIAEMYASGQSLTDIGVQFGLTPQRISQIVARARPEISSDDAREMSVTRLKFVESKMLAIIAVGPGPLVDVKGDIVYDANGEALVDWRAVIAAADVMRKVNAEIRRADALDLPRRKQIPEEEAMRQVKEFLAKMPRGEVEDNPLP